MHCCIRDKHRSQCRIRTRQHYLHGRGLADMEGIELRTVKSFTIIPENCLLISDNHTLIIMMMLCTRTPRGLCETLKVKPNLQWTPQDIDDARTRLNVRS